MVGFLAALSVKLPSCHSLFLKINPIIHLSAVSPSLFNNRLQWKTSGKLQLSLFFSIVWCFYQRELARIHFGHVVWISTAPNCLHFSEPRCSRLFYIHRSTAWSRRDSSREFLHSHKEQQVIKLIRKLFFTSLRTYALVPLAFWVILGFQLQRKSHRGYGMLLCTHW